MVASLRIKILQINRIILLTHKDPASRMPTLSTNGPTAMNWTTAPAHALDYNTVPTQHLLTVKPDDLSAVDKVVVRDRLLTLWQDSKTTLNEAQANEVLLRKAVVDFATDPKKEKGTVNVELGNGWLMKAVKKINISFKKNAEGKTDRAAIDRALAAIEKEEGNDVVTERLIKWTPALSESEYKTLSPKYQKLIDAVLIRTPGTPTLEIVPPKATV